MMTKEEVFEIWSPAGSRWSPWVKPVLFACMEPPLTSVNSPVEIVFKRLPAFAHDTALVVDLPGSVSAGAGLELARIGYRPIPLYNALPGPLPSVLTWHRTDSLVEVQSMIAALYHGAPVLQQLRLPSEAPPVFLLDANRWGNGRPIFPGNFDNRSFSFTTDFPSAKFLLNHGIRRVVFMQEHEQEPKSDVARTLWEWQKGGLVIEGQILNSSEPPKRLNGLKPNVFKRFWQYLMMFGLRSCGPQGFGRMVPHAG